MARKVFISVLGAGLYEECKYVTEGFCSSATKFVQQATLEYHHSEEWPEDSIALILLTERARKENWEVKNDMRRNSRLEKDIPYVGLCKTLNGMNLPFAVRDISIPDGGNEKEMWDIFDRIYELLEEGDELYFDLTHSFRYLPMLILVFGNYAKFLKKATVRAITYGNYEGRNTETNEAPIIDLLPLSALQDWTFATADYLENGYTDRLAMLAQDKKKSLIKDMSTREEHGPLFKMVKLLDQFTSELRTCRGIALYEGNTIQSLKEEQSKLTTIGIPQLKPLLSKIEDETDKFNNPKDVKNLFIAAKWCYKRHLYQQAITFLREGVISYFCPQYGIELRDHNKRELVSKAFNVKNKAENEWDVKETEKELLAKIANELKNDDLVRKFKNIMNLRNDYNHCGMNSGPCSIATIKDNIKDFLSVEDLLVSSLAASTPSCFINLSNHPTKLWTEKQLAEAKKYGKVMDMEFPHIQAEMSEEEIEDVAEEYVQKIMDIAKEYTPTVHIMGEQNFVFHVVTRLKEYGVVCVASTTERHVEENEDGSSTRHFDFVKFRRY